MITIFTKSPSMAPVRALIDTAAKVHVNLLISGEPGAGRETLARAVHGNNGGGHFVAADCATLNAGDFEARVTQARGGTLFLRHLVDLSDHQQARLAQMRDIRLMAAVDSASSGAVRRARIVPQLLGRLSTIDMPALRDRRDDIPALASWFLDDFCRSSQTGPKQFNGSALELLSAFPWKGNGRELGSFVRAVASTVHERLLGSKELLAQVRLESGALAAYRLPLREARQRFEREYIATVIEQHHGRIDGAAHALGLQRTNLYRKMRQLRLKQNRIQTDTESRKRA